MMEEKLIKELNEQLAIEIHSTITRQELEERLAIHIDHLINSDFNKLIQILYRIDVSEKKLRELLNQDKGKDAAKIIALMIVERQIEKHRSKKENKSEGNERSSDEERW